MSDELDVAAAVDEVKEFIRVIGDGLSDQDIESTGMTLYEETPLGFVCDRGGNSYSIVGHEQDEYLIIVSWEEISRRIAERIWANADPDDKENLDPMEEANDMLNSINDEQMDRFDYYLREKIASEHVGSHILQTPEGNAVRGFLVERKIFPHLDSFDIANLDSSIQKVISVTWRGTNFVNESFDFETIEEGTDVGLDVVTR